MIKTEISGIKVSGGDKSIGTVFTINYWPFSFARSKLSKKEFDQLESTIHKKIEDLLEKNTTKDDIFYLKNKSIIENIVNKIMDSEISKSFNQENSDTVIKVMEYLLEINIDLFEKIKVIEFIKNWSNKHIENIFALINILKIAYNKYGKGSWNNYYLFSNNDKPFFNFAIVNQLVYLGNNMQGTKEQSPLTDGKMQLISFNRIFEIIWDIHNKMIEQKEIY